MNNVGEPDAHLHYSLHRYNSTASRGVEVARAFVRHGTHLLPVSAIALGETDVIVLVVFFFKKYNENDDVLTAKPRQQVVLSKSRSNEAKVTVANQNGVTLRFAFPLSSLRFQRNEESKPLLLVQ